MKGATGGRVARLRRPILTLLTALLGIALSGCVHANASMTISGDDRVSGEAVISTDAEQGRLPFRLRPPRDLVDRVRITPFSGSERTGSRVSFDNLSFREVERLSQALSPAGPRYRLRLHRSGSLVTFDTLTDLTPVSDSDSSFRIEISAPGEVTSTNGDESADMVTWSPEPGEVSDLTATYQYTGAHNQEWVGWALLVGGTTIAVALAVGVLAQQAHERARQAAGEPVPPGPASR